MASLLNHPKFAVGDCVVFRKTKFSEHPGPRASQIQPAAHGDNYAYTVDKFWVVTEVDDDEVKVVTRRGKRHRFAADDLRLRPAKLWERLWYRDRYDEIAASIASGQFQSSDPDDDIEPTNTEDTGLFATMS